MVPDYELQPTVRADTAAAMKALADPVRSQILDLVLERAASVTELAVALGRPKSSVAYHVDVLVEVGLLTVVRTRQVRAIQERLYGRTARTIVLGDAPLPDGTTQHHSFLNEAAAEVEEQPGYRTWATIRHARISAERAEEFFDELAALAERFTELPREGDVVCGLVAGVYPTAHPTLPDPVEAPHG